MKVLAALDPIKKSTFEKQLSGRTLEQALSRIRRIEALLSGAETLDGLSKKGAADLDLAVCQAIVKELDVKAANLKPVQDFAAWARRGNYHSPLEVFTVNYDLLLEMAFEHWQVPYFDGFIGTLEARFRTELVESLAGSDCMPSFFVRLWKLHGSLNWKWDDTHKIVRLGMPVPNSAAIYPSDTKYDESRRMPFVVLQDRFRRALHHPETVVLVSGYSFGDDHLNEMLFDAATRRERSEIVVFCFDEIPDNLAHVASITPNIQVAGGTEAIIGGVREPWKSDDAPSSLWENGRFTLGSFSCLAAFLAKTAITDDPTKSLLEKLQQVVNAPAPDKDGTGNA